MNARARLPMVNTAKQPDRAPVSTYEQAVWRLVALRNDPEMADATYDVAIQLVADIFWTGDKTLRRDVMVAARQIDTEKRQLPKRHEVEAW